MTFPSLIEEGTRAFWCDLAQLLREAPGQWVAYRGPIQIGVASTKSALYRHCLGLGLQRGGSLVRSTEPTLDEVLMGPVIPPARVEDRGPERCR